LSALPRHALEASVAAALIGIAIAVIREKSEARWTEWIPSVAGFGFALILPGEINIPTALGGIAGWIWMHLSRSTHERYAITVASGMIVGEALLGGLFLPVLTALGVTSG